MCSAFAVAAVTAPSTSVVSQVTLPATRGSRPAATVLCRARPLCAERVNSAGSPSGRGSHMSVAAFSSVVVRSPYEDCALSTASGARRESRTSSYAVLMDSERIISSRAPDSCSEPASAVSVRTVRGGASAETAWRRPASS